MIMIQPSLFPAGTATGGSMPPATPESARFWFERMRAAVEAAAPTDPVPEWADTVRHGTCPECGLVTGKSGCRACNQPVGE